MSSRRSSSRISKLPARVRRSQWALHRAMAEPLEPRRLLSAELVRDISALPAPEIEAGPAASTLIGDTLFFVAGEGVHGLELWKGDGTEGGGRCW